jgi:hypothetical protein
MINIIFELDFHHNVKISNFFCEGALDKDSVKKALFY